MKTDDIAKKMKKAFIKTKNGIFKMLNGLLGKIILLLVLGIVIILMVTRLVNRFNEMSSSDDNIVKTTITVEEIRKINKLVTASFYEELLLEDSKLYGLFPQTRYLAVVVRGTVKAGFDLSELSEDDVMVDEDGTLHVNLPDLIIWNTVINFKDTEVIYTFRDAFDNNDEERLVKKGAEQIKKDAVANGIKEKAIEHGKSELTRLFGAMGFDKVEITMNE